MDIAAVMNTSLTCMYSSPSVVNSSVFSGENLRQTQIEITVNISAQNQKGKLYVKDVFKTIKIFYTLTLFSWQLSTFGSSCHYCNTGIPKLICQPKLFGLKYLLDVLLRLS